MHGASRRCRDVCGDYRRVAGVALAHVDSGIGLARAIDAFYTEHRLCGELDAEVTDRVWIACSCGAHFSRGGPPQL